MIISTVDQKRDPEMELCFKAGCVAINRVSRYFEERAQAEPAEVIADEDPIEDPTRQEFFQTYDQLQEEGVALRPDREAAWQKYKELRTRYSDATQFLGKLTMAPESKPVGGNHE